MFARRETAQKPPGFGPTRHLFVDRDVTAPPAVAKVVM